MRRRFFGTRSEDTLGVNAGSFRGMDVGCLGAVLLVVFTAASLFGLVSMVWWLVWKNEGTVP